MKIICPLFYKNEIGFKQKLVETMHTNCDYIEIRLDQCINYDRSDLHKIVQNSNKPIIFTIRTSQDGGFANLDTCEYEKKINELFQIEKCLIDVELNHLKSFKTDTYTLYKKRMILSYHNFNYTPNDLDKIWEEMEKTGAYIHKIACMPQSKEDVLRLLISCLEHKTKSKKCAISMSELGKISRLIGALFESEFTFCTTSTISAPGQVSLEEMVALMDILDI